MYACVTDGGSDRILRFAVCVDCIVFLSGNSTSIPAGVSVILRSVIFVCMYSLYLAKKLRVTPVSATIGSICCSWADTKFSL